MRLIPNAFVPCTAGACYYVYSKLTDHFVALPPLDSFGFALNFGFAASCAVSVGAPGPMSAYSSRGMPSGLIPFFPFVPPAPEETVVACKLEEVEGPTPGV